MKSSPLFSRSRIVLLTLTLLLTGGIFHVGLRQVSADTFGKFGITEQSRVGKLIKRIAPSAKLSSVEKAAPFATLTVTSGGDSGAGTLRNQIAAAASGDTIVFSGVTTVTLTSGELLINKNLTINGGTNGVTVTRGSGTFRIFNISSGTVSMSKLTITSGNPTTQAGGIQNSGNLTMTDCAITGNTSPQGGGIQNDGALTMTNCTVSGNTSSGPGGGFAMFGTTTTLTNCTVSGNTSSSTGGGFSISSGTLNLTNCTVTNNTGTDGGAIDLSGSSHVFKNTIIANNTATSTSNENIAGTVSSTSSYNLIGVGGTGGLTNGTNGNQVSVASPGLDALANNGGYTQTHSLLGGSLALDKGAAVAGVTTDQRGQTRPFDISTIAAASGGNNSDIGAYEYQVTCGTLSLSPTSLPSGTVGVGYSQSISATGGSAPYTYAVTVGSLPAGLTLQSGGTLSGFPSASGTSNFTVTATDAFGCTGSQAYSITIAACTNTKTYTVNDTGDASDATPGDSVCATAGGVCTLRAAIEEINAATGCVNNIGFSVTGTINMTSAYPTLAGASITFTGPGASQLTIRRDTGGNYRILNVPSGAGVTISGLTLSNGLGDEGGAIRNAGLLTLNDCVLSGNATVGARPLTGGGAGVFNDATGSLTLNRCAVVNNTATGQTGNNGSGSGGGGGGLGGGVYNNGGAVTITNTTLSGNRAVGGAGGAGTNGCCIGNGGAGGGNGGLGGTVLPTTTLPTAGNFGGGGGGGGNGFNGAVGGRFGGGGGGGQSAGGGTSGGGAGFLGGGGGAGSSSVSRNGGGGGGGGVGGAIFQNGGTTTILNATIVNNTVTGGTGGASSNAGSVGGNGSSRGGGLYNESGALSLKNSIVAGNSAQQTGFEDCDNNGAAITTNGYNLFGSGTGNPTGGAQDQTITPANVFTTALYPLGYYGGQSPSHRPIAGSPVIDKGSAGTTVDQRNRTRPVDQPGIPSATSGNGSDIGALELALCSGSVSISPTTLAAFGAGIPNTRTLTASGGSAPYTFVLASGALPVGVTLSSAGVLSGAANTTGTYTFSILASDQNDCIATQAYTLDVITCPTVTAQPQSQPVCDGGSVTLSVTLSDPTGFSYQWRKGGANISGATSSTYTIGTFTPADVASYDVVMTSVSCQVTSSAASLTTLGLTTMTNAMPYWAGRLNGAQFEVGTVASSGANTWPATEPPGNAFDDTFAKSLIRNSTNTGYVFTPGSCDAAGRVINQMRIYTANDSVARDPASYAIYGTTSVISGNGPFAAAQFTLISSGSLALPSGRNTSSLSDTNSQLVSFANSTAYKSYMLVFPTNSGDGVSTQIGEVKFYPENYQPTLSATTASVSQGQTTTGNSIGTATTGTAQAANTLTTAVSSDGTNFSSSATLNGVTISNVAVAANGNVAATLAVTCAATNASFTVRITNNQSVSVTATVNVTVAANTAPTLTYGNVSVNAGNATTVNPATGPSDNVSISTIVVQDVTPSPAPATITVHNSTGVVTVPNNVPGGTYAVTIRATDNCGSFTDAPFTLTVNNITPTLGNYSATTMALSAQATVTPDAAPTNTTGIAVKASSGFNGTFYANPATGVVKIVNANPAGTHTVTVTAFSAGGSTTKTFTLTVQSGTACTTTPLFSSAANLTVGSPFAVAVGDFNNDGKQDLAISNNSSATVSIRLGNGAGGFTGTTTVSTATNPIGVAVGDFNGDGNQDLAVACSSGASVSIRLGDGAGNFSGSTNISVSGFPSGLALGDFNGDGKLDFAVSSGSANVISVRLGDGAGGFTGSTAVSVGNGPNNVAVGDFNGDGFLDFASSNNSAGTASIRLGDGAGNFSGTTEITAGTNPSSVAVGDFNKDGKLDLAVTNFNSHTTSIRLGDGLGGFSGTTNLTTSVQPNRVVVGDLNNDGNPDLIVSRSSSVNNLDYLLGDGLGGFGARTTLPITGDLSNPALGDFNGDGRQDFITTDADSGIGYVRLGGCNVAPTITAGGPLARQAGSAGSSSTIATVSDTETAAGSLTVTATTVPTGITVTGITNTSGTVTATVTAACNATIGANTVVLTVTDGNGATAMANLTVNVTAATPPTTSNAGPDQTLCATAPATLAANTPSVGTGAWSIVSGPSLLTSQFNSLTNPAATFTPTGGVGAYTLRWTITGSCATSTDDVMLTYNANPTVANAGMDQTLCATSATLAANTPTIGTGSWSIISGTNGTVTTPSSPTSGFTGTAGTTYTLRWTISNAPCTASTDDVVITLTANPTTAAAGPDQAFCGTSAATLAASTPTIGTGAWTVVSGPSTSAAQFSSASSPTATFTPAGGTGTYTLRWTISNSPCTASTDDVVLTYNVVPTITLGASPSVLPGATSANLTYSATTGSPNQYSIDYDSTANTAGFVDVTNASLTTSPIVLTVPNGAASATYNATLTVRNSSTGCVSSSTAFTVTISNCPTAFTVNNTGDGADATPGNGVCETATGNGICTLRAAIQEANALTACSPMTITITATGTITLGSMLPGIARSNLTISGPGSDQLTVSGNNAVTVLQINASAANITISDLTIANGRIVNSTGAGLQNFSNGAVALNNLGFTGNQTITGGDGAALNHNGTGTLNVNGSTFSGNVSASLGGALATSDAGTVNLTNCTFNGNTALNGGAVYNNLGNLTLLNCTLSGNTATGSAGGLGRTVGTVNLKNTLVAGNTAPINPDVQGTFVSQGNNLIGSTTGSTGFGGTDLLNVNALLGAFGNYGGTTNTIPLLPGSPAINAGTATGAPANDQRSIARVGNVDIGAFESRGFTLAINGGNNQSAVVTTVFALPLSLTVTSSNSEPVSGGQVTFTPPGSGASATIAGNPANIASGAVTSGTVTANAMIGGPYNVAASANGATAINFSLTNTNSLPTIVAQAGVTRQAGTAGSNSQIATVNDAESGANGVTVTVNGATSSTVNGVTVSGIVNSNGTVSANIVAACGATTASFTLTATDGNSGTATANLTVTVSNNTAPTVAYGNVSVAANGSTTNSPTTATDNGSITGYAIQSQGTYIGTISVNASGLVSISNAVPPGAHTITVRATDNCGATTDATFTLNIGNNPPTITAQAGVTRHQNAGASNSQIATVADTESGANGVTVTVNGGNSATVNGVTVSNIVNSSGTVTANIVAICGASNASFTLTATDGNGATATATLNVTVTGIAVTPTTLVNGLTFVSYSATLSATGGTGNYTFSLVSGTLPAGLTLSGNTITGVPTTAGAETFTIRADDDGNTCFGERSYTLIIGSTGLMYYPLSRPVRLLDTRAGASPNACHQPNAPIAANGTRTQQARGACEGLTIPANATTLTGNITVVQPGGNGFLTMFPSDAPQPTVANSNFVAGEVLNNAFTVGIGAKDGAIKIFTTQTTHVVVDVTGYYAPPGAGGLYFHPLPKPIRLLETRSGFTGCFAPAAPLVGGTNTTQVGTLTCDGVTIPAGAQALVGNATTVNPQAGGYLTLYPADAVQPFVASSNYATGQTMNGPFTVGLSPSGDFKIFTNKTTDLVIDIMGYYSTQVTDANGQGLLFNSLGSPLRLLDTRNIMNNNACYQPNAPMAAQAVYTQETQIPCTNLTPTARALIGNVTVVAPAEAGWLTFWPSDAAQQPTTATSNYTSGQVFNRYFTVGLGPDAAFKRYSRRTTEVVIDISGFFAP